ncbi:ROK family transcriptional regulator, partial [Gluconobacter cerinus]|uniref:ROK family protein n=1 Tax=Gluconobacter cerinus TaxID=38307 RepID=UPI001B8CEBC1|nr:ROK family transcriptional regulator [Gluconobacter cerinus]
MSVAAKDAVAFIAEIQLVAMSRRRFVHHITRPHLTRGLFRIQYIFDLELISHKILYPLNKFLRELIGGSKAMNETVFPDGIARNIVALLARQGGMTRSDIASSLQLSKGRVSVITGQLMSQGIIEEYAYVPSSRRPSSLLRLHPKYASFIGISLHNREASAVVIDPNGTVLAKTFFERGDDYETSIRRISEAVTTLKNECPSGTNFAAVGMALPAYVSMDKQVCITSSVLGWDNRDVSTAISKEVGLPVFVENDTNALAVYESMFGGMRHIPAFVVIAVGDGIGVAYTIDGSVHHGEHGGAGELAHLPVARSLSEEAPRPCRCGNKGCLETVSSSQAIRARAKEVGLPPNIHLISTKAREGDPEALRILHTAANSLGYAAASLIQILDPRHIIIAIEDDLLHGVFTAVLRQFVEQNLMPSFNRPERLKFTCYDSLVWAIGAAGLASRKHLFRSY